MDTRICPLEPTPLIYSVTSYFLPRGSIQHRQYGVESRVPRLNVVRKAAIALFSKGGYAAAPEKKGSSSSQVPRHPNIFSEDSGPQYPARKPLSFTTSANSPMRR